MRRSTALLALVLVLFGAAAPLAEAVTGCLPWSKLKRVTAAATLRAPRIVFVFILV
jgi:hypothetical protein